MKKIKFERTLSLNKETVSKLNDDEMKQLNGGNQAVPKTMGAMCCFYTILCTIL